MRTILVSLNDTHTFTHSQLELAQDATEKRKQLEIEKEVTADLVEKYKV